MTRPDHSGSGASPSNLASLLQHAVARWQLPRLECQMLLLHTLGRAPNDRAWLLAHDRDTATPVQADAFAALCAQRASGTPVAYLTGEREFFGLRLQVDARVLDPRPDTETLVEWALEVLGKLHADHPSAGPLRVLDLGTGSGAIALALQRHAPPDTQVWALDASADALAVARANGERMQLPVHWVHSDWAGGWLGGWLSGWTAPSAPRPAQFHLLVSNPPYIPENDPHMAALHAEPRAALVAGPDGLADLRTIAEQARQHLLPGGALLLEHGHDQADAVAALLQGLGYTSVEHRQDLAGHRRCTGGQWTVPDASKACNAAVA
ncbi:MAG: peptide chain release factor N(5)-glutamine methyltransferase [Serpentinimonas sp.]|nr:peptide chain release factor N(5)-glutamine methyltransferase [Serpentinimonas sp.]